MRYYHTLAETEYKKNLVSSLINWSNVSIPLHSYNLIGISNLLYNSSALIVYRRYTSPRYQYWQSCLWRRRWRGIANHTGFRACGVDTAWKQGGSSQIIEERWLWGYANRYRRVLQELETRQILHRRRWIEILGQSITYALPCCIFVRWSPRIRHHSDHGLLPVWHPLERNILDANAAKNKITWALSDRKTYFEQLSPRLPVSWESMLLSFFLIEILSGITIT